jgi:5-methyltetrahydrofolate--homocysteine methyltransferase
MLYNINTFLYDGNDNNIGTAQLQPDLEVLLMIVIGEKINTIRNVIARAVEDRDSTVIQNEAVKQVEAGIDVLDINVGSPSNEIDSMQWAVRAVEEVTDIPLCIDSSNPDAIRAGFKACRGKEKAWANSIALDHKRMEGVLPLVKEHNCRVVALCIDEKGIPATAGQRVKIAGKIVKVIEDRGITPGNLYLDCLVDPISLGSGKTGNTLATIRTIKDKFPQVNTVICLSAVSFGLPGRRLINRTYLPLLIDAGIDAVFLDPLDEELAATLKASNALLDRDENCLEYIKAFREGRIKI